MPSNGQDESRSVIAQGGAHTSGLDTSRISHLNLDLSKDSEGEARKNSSRQTGNWGAQQDPYIENANNRVSQRLLDDFSNPGEPRSYYGGMANNSIEGGNTFFDEPIIGPSSVQVDMLGSQVRSRTFVPAKSNRRSSSLVHDGKDYYQNYEERKDDLLEVEAEPDSDDDEMAYEGIDGQKITPARMSVDSHQVYFNDNLVGECYLGFAKLLQSELKKLEKRDSAILSNRISRMSNRISSSLATGRGVNDALRNAKNDNFNPMNPSHISCRPGGAIHGGQEKR